ncbi:MULTISPECIES: protein kinase domain-containing protein [Chloracidobacterium]|jgi:serine/threonine protein kinase|uniref:non-specific serine/threonine protein kinase n=1 Tax=Chloracidobacterium thermophilum (strain B) TaxID=981222 RepID=G2LI76_CHLTF|nr:MULTISPECIES: protein kinase [Chloracidobacterium]AEP11534.1 Protein kinase domain protein [Chloracidobacterium thermophilum B]QUV79423.1 serine/threonine protein kinase [Chloracidobacterium thermophilum]QUV82460.1 serine/threonine protein kinase [Chloracidobacterium sp. D]
MKACPQCRRTYTADIAFCPYDGRPLSQVSDEEELGEDPLVGRVFIDRYHLTARIGEGGMCTVYRGTHVLTRKLWAVKILHAELAAQRRAVKRFQKEAQAASRIDHANVIQVTDFGTSEEGYVYLVMEYLEGSTLKRAIQTDGPFTLERTVHIVRQIGDALDAAHAQNVIHRDLKPENIMLLPTEEAERERVKVLDFGIAKVQEDTTDSAPLTAQNMVMGTPQYMSPEQAKGLELDARSDIYSLGIITYEMLTGKTPFHGGPSKVILSKHANEIPPSPRRLRPDLSAHVERVIMRALEKSPLRRQQSGSEFARELELAVRLAATMTKRETERTPVITVPALPSAPEVVEPPPPPPSLPVDTVMASQTVVAREVPRRSATWRTVIIVAVVIACVLLGSIIWWSLRG